MEEQNSFLLLNSDLQNKLKQLHIEKPTSVQNEIIPKILKKENVIFQSDTGTGKTFAYLLPLINNLDKTNLSKVSIIICSPTFELSSQINKNVQLLTDVKTALFLGGAPLKRQIEVLKEKPVIVTGTCARLVELIRLKKLKTDEVSAVVFDETDRLVKKESVEDTKNLRSLLPENVQIIACSATINKQTKAFFDGIDNVIMPSESIIQKNITHLAIFAERRDKIEVLRKYLTAENPSKALIFTSRSDQVINIYEKLTYKKISCALLHAKTDKVKRKSTIDNFRNGKIKILVTSDLSARGLDIPDVSHVIQMDLPSDDDFFIHRSGRTARAGKKGINVVIGDELEMEHYSQLEKKLGLYVTPVEVRGGKVQKFRPEDLE